MTVVKLSPAEYMREWRRKNPAKVKRDNKRRKKRLDRRSKNRWAMILHHVKRRCLYKNAEDPTYYERGIQCRLTVIEVAQVWFRDKAWTMMKPHFDRIDPDGHYEFSNVRFIEEKENLARKRQRITEREPGEEG